MSRVETILQCREHGGRFKKPEGRRGRNPVRCNPEEGWPCSAVETQSPKPSRKKRVRDDSAANYHRELAANMRKPSESDSTPRKLPPGAQASKAARERASELLESLGWSTALKGWAVRLTDTRSEFHASLTGNRGAETLYMEWIDGELITNDYAILDTVKPSKNGEKPEADLPFDPEEVSDRELVEFISGSKIMWWNTLGSRTETGICGQNYVDENGKVTRPPIVTIEHVYTGLNGPLGVDRLIKFVDANGGGTRVIKLGALLKVG